MSNLDMIPTVDLSPFFTSGDNEGKKNAKNLIHQACSTYGFFQVVNHGVPIELMTRAREVSKTFFEFPDEEKLKSSPASGSPLPAGYNKQPEHLADKNEYLMMFPPKSTFNVLPTNPSEFKEVVEDLFSSFIKTAQLLEAIVAECLGLPINFLQKFNDDRNWDLMVALHYFQATDIENVGNSEHEDGNLITILLQDEVGGLEVRKDGEWIPVTPTEGTLIVNIGDIVQVLSNDKYKSATHRVVRTKGRDRYSYAFFYNLQPEKWVEPLPEFSTSIGESPKYKRFLYKDYQALRMRNKTHPPSRSEDVINITHYSIAN
ncbi:flavonol synthase/flavanone 3-hydroxylase-like [Heracleum sosnowskyi]|uniref:Flavonol synthase/flavanone 3-hydroxylase-like n=1 Tax=Heracleum sosnowskyi TaxID=360622 RepID=A0AAD8H138_9APIA|nr:flavonol synthase/flavanone 3-hydroxylase-like [Heracleum sosnowskyi]